MHKFWVIVIATEAFLLAGFQSGVALAQRSSFEPIFGSDGLVQYPYGKIQPTLICRPLYICDIELQEGEEILDLGIGDSRHWVIALEKSGPKGNTPHVFVRPTRSSLNTNLVITTTRRVYYLRLISAWYTAHPYIGYYYPEVQALHAAATPVARTPKHSELPRLPAGRQLDYNYNIQGNKALVPQKVYNDGAHTFIQYSVLPANLPVLFTIASDGSNRMENFRLRKNTFIVDSVPSGIDLVLDAGTGNHGQGEHYVFIRRKESPRFVRWR
jgi:P-type conjugative transfer protein TrbG